MGLERHLFTHFARMQVGEITPQAKDRYKVAKAHERTVIEESPGRGRTRKEEVQRSWRVQRVDQSDAPMPFQILDTATEYGLIDANPAIGRRRRLKAAKPSRPWVEPEQLMMLLDATSGTGGVLLGILAGGGLRIGEALALRWQHVDLGTRTLHVVDAKTPTGVREVHCRLTAKKKPLGGAFVCVRDRERMMRLELTTFSMARRS